MSWAFSFALIINQIKLNTMKAFILILYCVLISGYVMNVVKFCKCDFEPSYKAEIIHGIGIVSGLGVVTGFIDCGK